jgi:putative acetyltransferase
MRQTPPAEISIRSAFNSDRARISQLHRESIQQLCTADYTTAQIQALLEDKKVYGTKSWGDVVLVAECGETIVGFSALMRGAVSAMYVHPEWTRQGIGKQLLQAIEREAISRRWQWLFVKASVTAVPFYQACGYQILHTTQMMVAGREWIPCVDMQKQLIAVASTKRSRSHQAETFWQVLQLCLVGFMMLFTIAKVMQWLLPR